MEINDISFCPIDFYILDAIIHNNNYISQITKFVLDFSKKRGIINLPAKTTIYSSIDKLTKNKIIVKVERTERKLFIDLNRIYEKNIKEFVNNFYILNRIISAK